MPAGGTGSEHEQLWAVQDSLDFPGTITGCRAAHLCAETDFLLALYAS
jgi:hypothetical protein